MLAGQPAHSHEVLRRQARGEADAPSLSLPAQLVVVIIIITGKWRTGGGGSERRRRLVFALTDQSLPSPHPVQSGPPAAATTSARLASEWTDSTSSLRARRHSSSWLGKDRIRSPLLLLTDWLEAEEQRQRATRQRPDRRAKTARRATTQLQQRRQSEQHSKQKN
ncbi:hypothetical protein niasHS_006035 [Heterodera schachtii]|uniref:Uncharacterized protein n=1 Tax=Heterodera schachtii TaxID=97005 RepID=A0ABD2JVR4_HETSC